LEKKEHREIIEKTISSRIEAEERKVIEAA
jgi:hypothetical protein